MLSGRLSLAARACTLIVAYPRFPTLVSCSFSSMRERNSVMGTKASMEIAENKCPTRWGWGSSYIRGIFAPNSAPVRTPVSMSSMMARPEPFGPPRGKTLPLRASFASVVGRPSLVIAHPFGGDLHGPVAGGPVVVGVADAHPGAADLPGLLDHQLDSLF